MFAASKSKQLMMAYTVERARRFSPVSLPSPPEQLGALSTSSDGRGDSDDDNSGNLFIKCWRPARVWGGYECEEGDDSVDAVEIDKPRLVLHDAPLGISTDAADAASPMPVASSKSNCNARKVTQAGAGKATRAAKGENLDQNIAVANCQTNCTKEGIPQLVLQRSFLVPSALSDSTDDDAGGAFGNAEKFSPSSPSSHESIPVCLVEGGSSFSSASVDKVAIDGPSGHSPNHRTAGIADTGMAIPRAGSSSITVTVPSSMPIAISPPRPLSLASCPGAAGYEYVGIGGSDAGGGGGSCPGAAGYEYVGIGGPSAGGGGASRPGAAGYEYVGIGGGVNPNILRPRSRRRGAFGVSPVMSTPPSRITSTYRVADRWGFDQADAWELIYAVEQAQTTTGDIASETTDTAGVG